MAGAVSPNRASGNPGINLAALGENVSGDNYGGTMISNRIDENDIHDESSQDESAREAAQVIEELQRA